MRTRSGYAKGLPTRDASSVSARTTFSSEASVMTLAPTRAPWLCSTERIVGLSLDAIAWRKAKSADRISAPCSRRPWFCANSLRNTRSPCSSCWSIGCRALLRMPRAHFVGAWRQLMQPRVAGGIGLREVRGRDHEDVSDHPVMDVAAQRDDAGLVKKDTGGRVARIELDLEGLRRRER